MSVASVQVGFFGKIPSRGDFVRAGLSRPFIQAWDDWLQSILPACQHLVGDAWEAVWTSAPSWRFALPAGRCGARPVVGMLLPSTDRAGRRFPLTIAAEGAGAAEGTASGIEFLDAAEPVGWNAVHGGFSPEVLLTMLAGIAPPDPAPSTALPVTDSRWWCGTGADALGSAISHAGLPEATAFAGMLRG